MKRFLMMVVFLASIMSFNVFAETLYIDNFEDGNKPNLLGGDFGSWDKDPSDLTQGCKMSFFTEIDGNMCAMLKYDVDSPNPAYSGFWMFLQGESLKGYKNLHISTKGDAELGFTMKIKLELKNDKKEVGKYLLSGITKAWHDFVIPLNNFSGITDFSKMTEFVIVFDDVTSTVKDGAIYIDNIYFE